MTENQDAPQETPARPVRVPNVSPNAKSGLDHEVIGSAAVDAYDSEFGAPDEADDQGPGPSNIEVPAGDLDSRIAWVGEAEDQDEAAARADAVYSHEADAGDTDLEDLGTRLRTAVYGDAADQHTPEPADPPQGDENAAQGAQEGDDGTPAPDDPTAAPQTAADPAQ